jgi:hypothetical protein
VTDDCAPFYAPNRKPQAERTPSPGVEVWRLQKDGHVLICELRDDEKAGGGFDVQILYPDRWPLFTQRCVTRDGAQFVAMSYRRDFMRDGWTDPR